MTYILFTSYDPAISAQFIEPNLIPGAIAELTTIINDTLFQNLYGENTIVDTQLTAPNDLGNAWVQWAAKSTYNLAWLYNYWLELQKIHEEVFFISHDSYAKVSVFANLQQNLTPTEETLTTPPNLTKDENLGIDFTSTKDVTQAYRMYAHALQSKKRAI